MGCPINDTNSISDQQQELLNLHERLLLGDPVATEEFFRAVAPDMERHLRMGFPRLAPGVDPDIYVSAVYEALTDYFKDPGKYKPEKSGLMTYLKMAAMGDLLNLVRKESRHARGRVSLESVEFERSDGNDVSERVAENLDGQRMIDDLKRGMSAVERAVFSLMLEGERSTQAAAEAMGIGHLSPGERAREVKRVKDRIKKRVQRRGVALR